MQPKGAVVDLDGTVYRDGEPIDGAIDGIKLLREAGCEILFVSNNPAHSPVEYVERLAAIGIDISPDQIVSSGVVTAEYLASEHADDAVFLIGSDGLAAQLRDVDIQWAADPSSADLLVASWTPTFDYDDMTDALRVLENDVPFYGSDPDRTFPDSDGDPIPGSGAIVNAIIGVTEREPDYMFGKPSELMVEVIDDRLEAPLTECLVIGDRLDTDIALGDRAGMTTVLTRTGIDDTPREKAERRADYVIDSLGDIGAVLEAVGSP